MIKEYDRCLRCGRRLKKPAARQIGYGDTCLKKMHVDKQSGRLFECQTTKQD